MIKEIKYNRSVGKFKSFLSGLKEEIYCRGTDYHLEYIHVTNSICPQITLYYYEGATKELRIQEKALYKINRLCDDYKFNLDKTDYYNIVCYYFFEKHNITGVTISIVGDASTNYHMTTYKYDKTN